MNWKMKNRAYQAVCMVALLVLAIALTTALVVAAERSATVSMKKATSQVRSLQAPTAGRLRLVEWV